MYITEQQDFHKFLQKAKKNKAVAIDTEFLRDKTYWPKLCLVQIAIEDAYALVDPFTVDITEIKHLLINENVVKVFHAPRQDVEILLHKTGVLPKPMFDTQLAASFLGHSAQIGYGNLVNAELGIRLNKADSYTDWSIRPLINSQLKYAKEDVTYLLKLYYKMYNELKEKGRIEWVQEEINQKFMSKEVYQVDLKDRYKHLKRANSLKNKQLSIAKEVSIWREKLAIERNIPRKWVLNDDWIIEVSRKQPNNLEDMLRLRGIKKSLSINDCRSLLKAVDKGKRYSKEDIAKLKYKKSSDLNDKHFRNADIASIIDLMSSLVRLRASQNNLAPQALSTNNDLKRIAFGERDDVATLKGWRKKIIGQELLDLMDGKISVCIKDGKVDKLCIFQ